MHFLIFSVWPGRIYGIPTDPVPQFKERLAWLLASSSKVYVSAPSLAVLAPPHPPSPQRWTEMEYLLSLCSDSQSLGPILPYLMHLGSFGFVCRCFRWEYITINWRKERFKKKKNVTGQIFRRLLTESLMSLPIAEITLFSLWAAILDLILIYPSQAWIQYKKFINRSFIKRNQ